ncbi:MAG TPA: indolepyruvate ferredoxin oxidoreductase subunit alpha [bacterium]|mgnify:CR=1 FL=1|nr:indolepyruvate ferredoxin oxidoreductase subunit alpha [bacterium]
MKKLLTGNEAIARGAWEAGVTFASAYPGTPSTEITEAISKYEEVHAEWAPNEKVAFESAIGASFGGVRTLVCMKHVGLNVAADPFCTLSYTGVNGGLVLICADDPAMHSSQNEQDNRYYARLAKVTMLEPSSSQEAKDYVKLAFQLSEKYDTPVMVRVTTRISHSRGIVELEKRKNVKQKPFVKDPQKYVMVPVNARMRHRVVEARQAMVRDYAEASPINEIEKGRGDIGVISAGVAYQYAREVFPEAHFLKLGITNPLPVKMIKKFAKGKKKLYVVEELEPFMEEQIKAQGISVIGKEKLPVIDELNPDVVRDSFIKRRKPHVSEDVSRLPKRPPNLCPGCPHRALFSSIKPLKPIVFGDIGCYTLSVLPPLSMHDSCVCMGASIGVSYGYSKVGANDTTPSVGVLGDSTFLHSGLTGVLQMAYNKGMNTVIILDNRTTAMTGGQQHPATGKTLKGDETNAVDFEELCKAMGVKRVFTVNPFEIKKTRELVKKEMKIEEPSIVISRAPCPLIYRVRTTPFQVDPDKCKECGMCLKINCPAITRTGNKATIVEHMCNGCSVCSQICAFNAISRVKSGKKCSV